MDRCPAVFWRLACALVHALTAPALLLCLLQGFTATFRKTEFAAGEWQEQLHAPEPPFTLLTVPDLLALAWGAGQREAYEAGGGDGL